MGLRDWIRKRMAETVDDDGDAPPVASLMYSVLGKDEEAPHALGEFTADTYPGQLANVLRRRQDVAAELMRMGIGSPAVRREAIPRLQELLRRYPHPLAYEALILAYAEQKRWDEARGVAFAARERRREVEHSPFPEIRSEIARLTAWDPEEVETLRREALGELVTPGVPSPAAAAPVAAPAGMTPALG
jgi:hypothetical protein